MVAEAIIEMLERDPFQPFRIRASSGETYPVRQPGLVVLLKSQVFIAEPNSDRFSIVPLLHVAGVELIGNGRSPRDRRRR